ncbi:hypothetical protein [Trueperella pyogenes]|uniref:hypothetical protein n=1 Tax=Trueperella pyogenes TaxID=1661 RepID=UPI00345DA1D3
MVHLATRVVVYEPDGDLRGYLTTPQSWSASFPMNDVAALKLTHSVSTPGAQLIATTCELAIEIWDGKTWTEPANARYRLLETKTDRAARAAASVDCTASGYADLLDGVVVIPPKFGKAGAYDKQGKRKFLSASVGSILTTVLEEARSLIPEVAPGLKLAFTPATDADGAAWARKITIYYEPGLSMLTILDNLAKQGQCDWYFVGRTLHVTNAKSTEPLPLYLPDSPREAPMRTSISGLAHAGFLIGESQTWRFDNPGTPTPWGKTMKVITQGGVREESTARTLVQSTLNEGAQERIEYTWSTKGELSGPLPFIDYKVGSSIHARGRDGEYEPMRVTQIALTYSSTGLQVDLTLNDRFTDSLVRAAKRTRGIVNGASGDAGTGTLPAAREPAKPKKVEGLVAESEGYWNDLGEARSLIRASWAPVTEDERGSAAQIAYYHIQAGIHTTRTGNPTVTIDDLVPNKQYDVTVWAVDADGLESEAVTITLKTVEPQKALDPPTKLGAEADFGIVELIWDGLLQFKGGKPYKPPRYFKHIRIEESPDQHSWTAIGTAVAGGLTLDRQDQLGKTLYYRAKSVTTNGIESDDYGPTSEVVVRSRVSDELERARRENADAIAQWQQDSRRLDEKLGTFRIPADRVDGLDSVIQAAASGTADITYSTSAPSGRGKKVGDVWWQKDDSGRIDGQWVWDGSTWVRTQIDGALVANLDVGRLTAGYGSLNEAVVRKLFAEVVTAKINQAGKFIGGDAILDGTVDASKVRSPEAWFKEIFTESLMAGRVTSRMFSTDAAFEGPGVRIDRTGWQITPSSGKGGIYANGEYGIFANDPDGKTTFHIKPNGEATFSGNLTSSATIKGVNLEGVTVTMKDGRQNGSVLTPSEIRYMEGGRNIGALSWRVLVAPPQGYIDCGETSVPNGGWSDLSFGYGGRQWAEFGMTVTSGGLVAPISGRYLVTGNAGVRGHGDSLVGVAVSTPGWAGGINVQTSQWAIGNGIEQTITATGVIDVRAGETIQLKIHNSGGAWATVGKASLFAKCISN